MKTRRPCLCDRCALGLAAGAAAAGLLLAACGAAFVAPEVSPELVQIGQKRGPDATSATLERGRATFVASCGKGGFCHGLRSPKSRTEAQWPPIVERMAKKAGLGEAERQDVLRFILAVRDLPEPPATRK